MPFHKLYNYFIYYSNAVNHYRIHSPLIYDFYFKVLADKRYFYAFERLEKYRNIVLIPFLSENKDIYISVKNIESRGLRLRHIRDLHKTSSYDIFVFKVAEWYQPDHIIDIHDCPSLTVHYLNSAIRSAPLSSISLSETANRIISKTISELESQNINLYTIHSLEDHGSLSKPNSYQKVLISIQVDLTNATVLQFLKGYLKANTNQKIALVIKGIHATRTMEEGWRMLTEMTAAKYTIDVFNYGLILISPKIKDNKYFTLIKFANKPIAW